MKKEIRFMKHYVTDGNIKARVSYSAFALSSTGQNCVTLYAKDYSNTLADIFGNGYENNTDIMTDYFEKGRVRILDTDPLYQEAMVRVGGK